MCVYTTRTYLHEENSGKKGQGGITKGVVFGMTLFDKAGNGLVVNIHQTDIEHDATGKAEGGPQDAGRGPIGQGWIKDGTTANGRGRSGHDDQGKGRQGAIVRDGCGRRCGGGCRHGRGIFWRCRHG